MLLDEKTLATYGYDSKSISERSNKLLIVTCDYCGIEFNVSKKNRHTNHLIIKTDACPKCKYIKMKEINTLKYGVDSVSKLDSVKEKIKNTNMDRYGGVAPSCDKNVVKKMQDTNLKKYGATSYLGSQEGQENFQKVSLEKYGVKNLSSAEEVKKKREETCKERFGKDTYLGSQACKDATIEKFGVDNVFKLEEYQKIAQKTKIEEGITATYHGKTVAEWAELNGLSVRHLNKLITEHGWENAIKLKREGTKCEEKIKAFLNEHKFEYKFTKGIGGFVPDFQVENLIIECDSYFYHSDYRNKDEDYHYNKFVTYNNLGYNCLFFTENEINNKWDIVKSMILGVLGRNIPIEKDLEVKIIDIDSANDFFDGNHILGRSESNGIAYGVFLGSKLCYAAIIEDCDITRFGERRGYRVDGLKLILEFVKSRPLTTTVDLRYGYGNLSNLGFVHESTHKSFKWTDGTSVFNRMQFPSNSGYDYGLFKIWDCGQAKWRINS